MENKKNLLHYSQLFFISVAFATVFIPLPLYILASMFGLAILMSIALITVINKLNNKKIRKLKQDILTLDDQKTELEECLSTKTQTMSYQNLKEIHDVHVGVIEEQTKELKEVKQDVERLYKALQNIDIKTSPANSFTDALEGLPYLFEQEEVTFQAKRQRKCSIGIHKKRLGLEEEEYTQSI